MASVLCLNLLVCLCLSVCNVRCFVKMTGPPKHKGIFHTLRSTKNKTIPYSEKPGDELIIFDVDETLWPYQIDSDPRFKDPFTIKSVGNGSVFVGKHEIHLFPEVEATLEELIAKDYILGVISLTNSTSKTMALLNAFDLNKHFKYMEIGPGESKLALVEAICSRSDHELENVLYFEKDPGEVMDMIWKHVIVYCVDNNGMSKICASKGLYVFNLRPRKDRVQFGPKSKNNRVEKTNKNKSRPAYEKDGTEIEGWDYNATKIEYEA